MKVQLNFLKEDTDQNRFQYAKFSSPLGEMFSICDDKFVYCLNFLDLLQPEQESFLSQFNRLNSKISDLLKKEVDLYYEGKLKTFTLEPFLNGTIFQKKAWQFLQNIRYGETKTYEEQSTEIHSKKAVRAVGNANGRNQIAVVVPCHRIVRTGGELGGFASGVERKKWLIEHEKKHK